MFFQTRIKKKMSTVLNYSSDSGIEQNLLLFSQTSLSLFLSSRYLKRICMNRNFKISSFDWCDSSSVNRIIYCITSIYVPEIVKNFTNIITTIACDYSANETSTSNISKTKKKHMGKLHSNTFASNHTCDILLPIHISIKRISISTKPAT